MIDPCKAPRLLSAFLDGELDIAEADAVKRHLEGCVSCRQYLEALARSDGLVRKMPGLEPSAEFNRTFWQKVDQLEARPVRRFRIGNLFSGWRPLLAGGVAGLVAALFIAHGPPKALTPEEMFIAENIEFLEDFELIRHLDMLESWEALEIMKEQS